MNILERDTRLSVSVSAYVHVIYPVSTDCPSVVAEVILDGRNSHLRKEQNSG